MRRPYGGFYLSGKIKNIDPLKNGVVAGGGHEA
jgi:hypothetical protein